MRKYIVLHDNNDNTPIIIFEDAILGIQAETDDTATVILRNYAPQVKESMGEVMKKLKEVQE